MSPDAALAAARVPRTLKPQSFGPWIIERRPAPTPELREAAGFGVDVGWPDYTLLRRLTLAKMHRGRDGQEIVMEDSRQELQRHLPILLQARGKVLVTGLGLGCVVRGLLANPAVEHIDVIEIDADIIRVVGAEFRGNSRVVMHCADALTIGLPKRWRWDYAWHDIWCEGDGLNRLHLELLGRFMDHCRYQGAWQLPRCIKRLWAMHARTRVPRAVLIG